MRLRALGPRLRLARPRRPAPRRRRPQAAPRTQSQAGHLPVHEGRPDRHVDTFDPKPLLDRDDGKPYPGARPRVAFAKTGNLLQSPWKFAKHGRAACRSANCSRTSPSAWTTSASSTRCTAPTRPTAGRRSSCTPAATPSSGPAWERGWPTGWGPRTPNLPGFVTICPTLAHGGVQQLGVGLPAGGVPGRPHRQRRRAGRAGQGPLHRQPAPAARVAAEATRPARRTEPRPPRPHRAGRRPRRPHRSRSSWRSGCSGDARGRGPLAGDEGDEEAVRPGRPGHRRTSAGSACWPGGSPSAACGSCR